jgi:TetR/AcrR family transcriptional regulator
MVTTVSNSSERILQSALGLFASKGYDATSVREICEASGITKPTLYHFFGSKEGVYRALVDGALGRFRTRVVEALDAPGTAEERLKKVAWAYFEGASSNRELMRFLFSVVHNPPRSAPVTDFPRFYQDVVDLVGRAVEEGVAAGTLLPGALDVRMLVFMGALGEALCGNLIMGHPDLTPSLADTLVETILDGWSAPRPAP